MRGRYRRPPHPPAPRGTGRRVGRRHAGRGQKDVLQNKCLLFPFFYGKTAHIFCNGFTLYLPCYSVVPRMVTIMPLWSKSPPGGPTRLRQGYDVASKSDKSDAGNTPDRPDKSYAFAPWCCFA